MNMQRYKLTIEYDGTEFSGWQIQPNARTVEQVLEEAFATRLQQEVDLLGQGRTDAGVHALGQTAHVDLPADTDIEQLIYGVNKIVGKYVQVISAEKVDKDFHARFDGIARQYEYTLTTRWMPLKERFSWQLNREVDLEKMKACAALLKGEFDFAGFSKFNEDNHTTLCDIQLSEFETDDDTGGEVIHYHIKANRFLRNMVRRLVGTMVWVGEGRMDIADFEKRLKNPEAEIQSYTAPAKGLILKKVFYN